MNRYPSFPQNCRREKLPSMPIFAELKEPFARSDGAAIYGYCFSAGDQDYSPGMGKGYAVFQPYGQCKRFKPLERNISNMSNFDKYKHHGKCEVCGKEADVASCMSSMGPMIFYCCRTCFTAGAEPYERMVSYIASAGEWPKDIGSAYQVEVRKQLSIHGKSEREFSQDVSVAMKKAVDYVYCVTELNVDGCGSNATEFISFHQKLLPAECARFSCLLKKAKTAGSEDSDTSEMITEALNLFAQETGIVGTHCNVPYIEHFEF